MGPDSYIQCPECNTGFMFDGYKSLRDALENRYGDPGTPGYTVKLMCPRCQEMLVHTLELRDKQIDMFQKG